MPQPGHFGQSQNALQNMEFTWVKTCRSPPCAFVVSRRGIFKVHVLQSVFLVFWHMFGVFPMHFLLKGVSFLRFCYLRLDEVYFFYALGTSVLCMCIFYGRVEIGLAHLLRVYFLTRALCIFLASAFFERQLWKQNPHFCCMCILVTRLAAC